MSPNWPLLCSGFGLLRCDLSLFSSLAEVLNKTKDTPIDSNSQTKDLKTTQKGLKRLKIASINFEGEGQARDIEQYDWNIIYAHIYIYIYIDYLLQVWGLQGLLSGPSRGYYLVQVCFLAYFYSGFKRFFGTFSYHFVCVFCAQLSVNFLKKNLFSKNGVQKKGFSIVSV